MLTDPELLHALPVAVLVTQQGVIRMVNAASVALLEADSPEQLLGRPPSDFVHTLDKLRSSNRIHQASEPEQAGQANKPSEFRIRTCQGHLRMVLISTVAIALDGAPALLMCGMDVTHQNEIQEQLRESERRTAESYYPQSSDRDAFKAAIMEKGEVSDFPGQMVRKDGTVIDISISSHALFDHNGNFAGVEGIYRDVTQRKNLERELQRLATTDMLTGMANRRAFLELAESTYQRARAQNEPLTLLMLDLDHFKSINDRFGHLEGDRVLVEFARTIKTHLRASDTVGRLGGEEFGLLLPLTSPPEGADVDARMLDAIRALELTDSTGQSYRITTSMGLSAHHPSDRNLRELLDRADQALYLAKHRGRNQLATICAADA